MARRKEKKIIKKQTIKNSIFSKDSSIFKKEGRKEGKKERRKERRKELYFKVFFNFWLADPPKCPHVHSFCKKKQKKN